MKTQKQRFMAGAKLEAENVKTPFIHEVDINASQEERIDKPYHNGFMILCVVTIFIECQIAQEKFYDNINTVINYILKKIKIYFT